MIFFDKMDVDEKEIEELLILTKLKKKTKKQVEQTMQIDITGSNLQSFLGIAQKFPNGVIVCEGNKAYWDFESQVQQINQQPRMMQQSPTMQQQKPQKKNTFLKYV